jgi:putative toxin-antitoxin system antitoxin component (TIGR02293 family)
MLTAVAKPKSARRAGARKPRSGKAGPCETFCAAGVVSGQIHRPKSKTSAGELSSGQLIEIIRTGLPVQELDVLRACLGVPMDKLVLKLGMSKATLHRRKAQGRLEADESDRVVRYARLMGKAIEVMEGEEPARLWLTSPQVGLGGAVPLDYAETEVGASEVADLLGRIEYGVYS